MNSKNTWIWIAIAAVLFAVVFVVEKYGRPKPPAVVALLPNFQAGAVTSVQFAPAGKLEIRAERTNNTWQLAKPITYPAQAASIEGLLQALQQLAPAVTLTSAEVRSRPNADEEFGFLPRTTLTLNTTNESRQLLIGTRTAMGDQVYVKVIGADGVFVLDAQLLQLLPTKPDDWRDTGLMDLRGLTFDRIGISNATVALQLQREGSNGFWRLASPIQARADNGRLLGALQKLQATRVLQFVTDEPRSDAESFGFHTPELELTLAQGTNLLATLQFGKSPTNDSTLVYARRLGFSSVVTVERQSLAPWLGALNQFRDPRLISFSEPQSVEEVTVRGAENFVIQRATSNSWRVVDSPLPIDTGLVGEFLLTLVTAPIIEFRDSITEAELPKYGLTEPSRHITLQTRPTTGVTNITQTEISLGAVKEDRAYVRRADEQNSVYAIGGADYQRLAVLPWQLRERQIWRFAETNVVRVTVQQDEWKKEVRRLGAKSWFAPGAPTSVNGGAVEDTVQLFGELKALAWVGRGEESRAQFGFGPNPLTVTIELKDGTKHVVEFGGASPDNYPYAAVKLDEQTWFFECPLAVFEFLKFALLNPAP